MLSRVERTIAEHALLAPGQRVLVGLSGGVDSWALLLALWKLRERLAIDVRAAVIDHGLRSGSAAEARATAAACAARAIPVQVVRLRLGATERTAGAGAQVSQEAARAARLDALVRLARRLGCQRIALGHQAEDQAETVLFRIVRGTGLRGLAGIPYRRGPFVRPLLDVRRDAIERFVARHGVVPVRDPSNANPVYARARLRHTILPVLRGENPRVGEALRRLAREARDAAAGTGEEPGAARRAAPRAAGAPTPEGWSVAARQAVRALQRAGRGSKSVDVRGARVVVDYGAISVQPRSDRRARAAAAPAAVTVSGPGRTRLWPRGPGLEIKAAARPLARAQASAGWVEFDADAVRWPLELRTWRAGDRMFPRGGVGRRKLQDLFVDAKIPRARRTLCPVLVQRDGTLLYVAGLRPAQHGRPGEATRAWLRVRPLGGGARRAPVSGAVARAAPPAAH